MISLTDNPIDPAAVLAQVASHDAGAVVLFLGTTREFTQAAEPLRSTTSAIPKWPRKSWPSWKPRPAAAGRSPAARSSIGWAIWSWAKPASPSPSARRIAHDAFAAGQWLIDTIKQVVPIWKQENWADGTSEWVHPGMNNDQ